MAVSLIPHSFVLADLFDVESMSLDVPDHILEDDPELDWTECPVCEGERWVEGSASVWTGKPTARPCPRCKGLGQILDLSLLIAPLLFMEPTGLKAA